MTTIYFDMDGTVADFYGVENWLNHLLRGSDFPYIAAKPLCNMNALARQLNALRRKGYKIGIISWTSKDSTKEFEEKVKQAKLHWLKKHLASVTFDEINIVSYGTNKWRVCGEGILFDDEEHNRLNWENDMAFEPTEITKVLSNLNRGRF